MNALLDDTSGSYSWSGNATVVHGTQTDTEIWSGSGSISYANDGQLPEAADSAVSIQDSQTIVLTLADWRKDCIVNGNGIRYGGNGEGRHDTENDALAHWSQCGRQCAGKLEVAGHATGGRDCA